MALIEGLWPPQGSRKIHIVHVESPSEIFVRDEILEDKWSQREEDFKRVLFICFYLVHSSLAFRIQQKEILVLFLVLFPPIWHYLELLV